MTVEMIVIISTIVILVTTGLALKLLWKWLFGIAAVGWLAYEYLMLEYMVNTGEDSTTCIAISIFLLSTALACVHYATSSKKVRQ